MSKINTCDITADDIASMKNERIIVLSEPYPVYKVAFIGKARSGKDYSADMLQLAFQDCWRYSLAFADALKEVYSDNFGHLEIDEKPRDALVTIGNAFRAVDPFIWIHKLQEEYDGISTTLNKPLYITLTDVRYPNEAQWCRDNGFLLVKTYSPDEVRVNRSEAKGETLDLLNEGDSHVDSLDYDILLNTADTEAFRKGLIEITSALKA